MNTSSLDDVATLLLQAESDDDPVLSELLGTLTLMLMEGVSSPEVHRCLSSAAAVLSASPRQAGALDRVRELVDQAIGGSAPVAPVVVAAAAKVVSAGDEIVVVVGSDSDKTMLNEFITESREYLQSAEASLLQVESDPSDSEAINTMFRAFHTVKGTSAFLGLTTVSDLAHTAESLLSEIREGKLACTPRRADLIFRSIDSLGAVLTQIAAAARGDRAEVPAGYAELLAELRRLEAAGYDEADESQTDAVSVLPPPRVVSADNEKRDTVASAAAASEAVVRVRTERLDRLVDMVGELVIAQSMLTQDEIVRAPGNDVLGRKVSHTGKIVRELQDLSMAMRMVPLKGPFQKVARLARDLAQRNGKLVEFVSDGEDTEIDRNLVDVLADPLVHMVRNSLDHGLELPDDRVAAGKPRHGTLRLSAYHSGGNVVVEIEDDGRGLNRERIVAKARERGLIDSADGMSVAEIDNLIFLPGFSTAEAVTEVSGRGVGMDVVRRNVEAMRGRIDISSTPGQGTRFTIRLPLTLAITDGMLVSVGAERYLVPTLHIRLSFRPEPSQLATIAGRGELVVVRNEPIPIIRLHRMFGIDGAVESAAKGLLMIVGDSRASAALLVDELLGQQQVVAKSLGDGIGRIPGIAGGAILGDGRVGLILDVTEITAIARRGTPTSNEIVTRAVA